MRFRTQADFARRTLRAASDDGRCAECCMSGSSSPELADESRPNNNLLRALREPDYALKLLEKGAAGRALACCGRPGGHGRLNLSRDLPVRNRYGSRWRAHLINQCEADCRMIRWNASAGRLVPLARLSRRFRSQACGVMRD